MKRTIKKIIFYFRLSKPKKGKSKQETIDTAHGIEAQRAAGERLRAEHNAKVIGEYVEIETGTSKRNRPQLQKAISHAKLAKATLVIAKLDRLARNVAFTSALMETQVDFVCCDNPEADKFTIHILAAAAENEARAISNRTKAALAVAKDKGVKLGSARKGHWEGREHLRGFKAANKASIVARQQSAKDAYSFLIPTIREMQKDKSLREIATWLNEQGHETTRGKPFTHTAIIRILEMFDDAAAA